MDRCDAPYMEKIGSALSIFFPCDHAKPGHQQATTSSEFGVWARPAGRITTGTAGGGFANAERGVPLGVRAADLQMGTGWRGGGRFSFRHQRRAAVAKGVVIEIAPLDEEHVRAKITWSEQDVGGGKLVVEVTVKNMKARPKTDEQLRSDAKALAVRFVRAFADTIEN